MTFFCEKSCTFATENNSIENDMQQKTIVIDTATVTALAPCGHSSLVKSFITKPYE